MTTAPRDEPDPPGEPPRGEIIQLRPEPAGPPQITPAASPPPGEPRALPWEADESGRRPAVPGWLSDSDSRRAAAGWAARSVRHHAVFHALRTPWYLIRVGIHIPVGAVRLVRNLAAWVSHRESHELLVDAVARRDRGGYLQVEQRRAQRRKARLTVLGIGAAVAGGLLAAAYTAWPPAAYLAAGLLGGFLAWLGRPRNKPYFEPAVVADQVRRLSPDLITNALGSLGIGEINKWLREGRDIPMMIGRDGPGWRADIDLPPGATPAMIMDKRAEFASGLRRPVGCVWPGPSPEEHGGRLSLYVADTPLSKARQQPWPLAKRGKGDIFKPLPFGTDQRGHLVTITLIFESMLITG